MEGIPFGFILLIFALFAVALIGTIAAFVLKQRRISRLKNPHKDYYR